METTTENIEASKPSKEAAAAIALTETGAMVPRNMDEALKTCNFYLKSKMLPARFNTVEMVFTAMQYALELGLKPITALRQIAVVQGTPCTFGDLPLALVQQSGKMESIREYVIDQDGEEICAKNKNLSAQAVCAVCIVKRKGDPEPLERFFSLDDAKTAGLNSPTWKSYPKTMLKYRARSQALKDKFPDCLNGIAIAEYDYHVIPTEDSPRLLDAAEDLNAEFTDKKIVDADMPF